MKKTEKIAPKGTVRIRVYDAKTRELVFSQTSNNLVVNTGRTALAALIGSGNAADYQVTQAAWGEDGTTPLPTNTSLTNAYVNAPTGVSYPAFNKVRFALELTDLEANGKDLAELGLLCTNGDLFARYTWGGNIQKTSGIYLEADWEIEF